MKLSTGKVAFPIEFDNGDKQNIYFNPNDPGLPVRMKDFQSAVEERMKGIGDIQLNSDGKISEDDGIENIERFRYIQNVICEELDVAFNGDVSSIVFKYCSPFAIVNGEYFIMQFMKAIVPEIEKHIKAATANVEKKMAKHIDKYKK